MSFFGVYSDSWQRHRSREHHAMKSKDSFMRLFLQQQDEIHAFIYATVRDLHVSRDILQEVAIVLWEKFDEYDANRSFAAWARGIAIRKIRQHWRQQTRAPRLASETTLTALADAYDATESTATRQARALRECMKKLPSKSRRMLALRYDRSLSLSRVAEILARTLAGTQKALSRIRGDLQKCVEAHLREAGS